MDSMRSLNSSLPSSTSTQPPEQLLQAFKTAALSVTNLYKTAVADQANARHLGYQEALEDFRAFLDRERLALDDGDGAKIRRWVISRIDGTGSTTTSNDSDDEKDSSGERRTRSSSPAAARKETPETANQPRQQTTQPQTTTTTTSTAATTATPVFTFTAGPQWPTTLPDDVDMQSTDSSSSTSSSDSPHLATNTSPAVRVEVIPRGGPRTQRNNHTRHGNRSTTREQTASAGSKRKFHFGDFFDISNIGNGKDGFAGAGGGVKRGRFI
ncbi:hypothetical protein VTO42DRAFT_2851 [Malbranchea cinnamomea]